MRVGDIPDQKKNIWHETKSECRIYNSQVVANIIKNYDIEITSLYVNYVNIKNETTRDAINGYISNEKLKEFQYKNARKSDRFFIEWCEAGQTRVVEHKTVVPTTKRTIKRTTKASQTMKPTTTATAGDAPPKTAATEVTPIPHQVSQYLQNLKNFGLLA